MKKLIAIAFVALLFLPACQEDKPLPEVKLTIFSIKELPDFVFSFDESSDPILITNTVLLPANTNLETLTPEFAITNQGSLMSEEVELISGLTSLDFSGPVFLKVIDPNGEIDHYYQVNIQVESITAPEISELNFTLNPYFKAPLAGLLEIELDRACTLKINIIGQNNNNLVKLFSNPATSFSVPVLGLYPQSTNHVVITVTDQNGEISQESLFITTDPLPEIYPGAEVMVSEPEAMEPGMILVYLKKYNDGLANGTHPLACLIDPYGKVRWMFLGDYNAPFMRLRNGNWLIGIPDGAYEMDMLGNPTGEKWNIPHVHHDIVELPNGNFLALSEHDDSVEDVVLEISREGGYIENEWDIKTILDPSREKAPYHPISADWLHLNGMDYDPIDDAIILSGRNQSAVVKIDKQTGNLIWILGNHDKWPEELQPFLLTPVGENFEWQWGQHAPMLHPDDHSRLLLFDNGNERSYENPLSPMDSYSRGVEYQIDESTMEVRQLWQYGKERGRELFCPYISDANYLLQTDNRLICFGGITRDLSGSPSDIFNLETGALISVKNYVHIIEVDNSGHVVFEVVFADKNLSFAGYRSYRAEKVSLYPE